MELLVTMTVMVILLSLSAPPLGRLLASNRITSHTNELVGGLNLARSEAVRRGQGVSLRTTNTTAHDFAAGWAVFTDLDEDGAPATIVKPEDGTTVREQSATSSGMTIKRVTRSAPPAPFTYTDADSSMTDRDYVVFNSRGASKSGTATFFRVCDPNNKAVPGRIVQVSPVGKVSLDSTKEPC